MRLLGKSKLSLMTKNNIKNSNTLNTTNNGMTKKYTSLPPHDSDTPLVLHPLHLDGTSKPHNDNDSDEPHNDNDSDNDGYYVNGRISYDLSPLSVSSTPTPTPFNTTMTTTTTSGHNKKSIMNSIGTKRADLA